MGVSIFYSGTLSQKFTVDDAISRIEDLAIREGIRSIRHEELVEDLRQMEPIADVLLREDLHIDYRFIIPQHVMENPEGGLWAYPNSIRIMNYARDARIPIDGKSHQVLCQELNAAEFKQSGVYLDIHEKSELLKILFCNNDREMTQLSYNTINGDVPEHPMQVVHFLRQNLFVKTGYETVPQAHFRILDILHKVKYLCFDGNMTFFSEI